VSGTPLAITDSLHRVDEKIAGRVVRFAHPIHS
jgi:hypothetical protein